MAKIGILCYCTNIVTHKVLEVCKSYIDKGEHVFYIVKYILPFSSNDIVFFVPKKHPVTAASLSNTMALIQKQIKIKSRIIVLIPGLTHSNFKPKKSNLNDSLGLYFSICK